MSLLKLLFEKEEKPNLLVTNALLEEMKIMDLRRSLEITPDIQEELLVKGKYTAPDKVQKYTTD